MFFIETHLDESLHGKVPILFSFYVLNRRLTESYGRDWTEGMCQCAVFDLASEEKTEYGLLIMGTVQFSFSSWES